MMEPESDCLINNLDLKKLCRMCLKNEKILKSMFYCSVGEFSYAEVYEQCTGFNISQKDHNLNCTSVCTRCENELLFVFEFSQRVQHNEKKLEQLLLLQRQNDHKNSEIERDQFLEIDDNFLDYNIDSLDECKFRHLIDSVKCTTCLHKCETEETINRLGLHDSYSILCECGVVLGSRVDFREHCTEWHATDKSGDELTASEQCNVSFTLDDCNQVDEQKKTKKTSCSVCGEQFNHRSTKISHMVRIHGAKRALMCNFDGCDYATLKRERYQSHLDKHADPDKKFSCCVCRQEFNSLHTRNLHRAKHSSPSLTYRCSHCDKIFLDKRNYQVHLRLHTRENLFYCAKCKRGFNRKEHLANHLRRKTNCDKNATHTE